MATPGFNFSLIVIMTTLFSRSLSQTACAVGWFGTGCKYKCRCSSNVCQSDGACGHGVPCVKTWFGPGCQYQNVLSYAKINEVMILDYDISTCNQNTPIITADLDGAYHFTWLRIVFNITALGQDVPGKVTIFFKDTSDNPVNCIYTMVFTVNPSTVDFHCDIFTRVRKMAIYGNDTLRICEVYFSGGRNLATKQSTNQSSTLIHNGVSLTSNLAVDGNRESDLDKGSCSHTDIGRTHPSWFLIYPRSVIIYRIVLYNRNIFRSRLAGFTLKLYDVNGAIMQSNQEPGVARLEYRIVSSNPTPVNFLSIEGILVVSLCEVETFAEMVCPSRKWGLDCMDDCQCRENELCSPITGKCDKGCEPGFHGLQCELNCPTNCLDKECFRKTGICVKCPLGYTGDDCDKDCLPNKYGDNCLLTCHSNCRKMNCNNSAIGTGVGNNCSDRLCDHDGLCNACLDPTHYGENCTLPCPSNCQFRRCDSKNGSCFLCNVGYFGKSCSQVCSDNCKDACDFEGGLCYDCKSTFYGDNCALECPITCTERACHVSNGSCLKGCPNWFYGESCTNECPKTCINNNCHDTEGTCLEGCEAGFFDENCSNICPRRCNDRICRINNGSCYTCDVGYYGVICELHCSADCEGNDCDIYTGLCSKDDVINYHFDVFAPIVAVVVLLLFALAMLWTRERESFPEEET